MGSCVMVIVLCLWKRSPEPDHLHRAPQRSREDGRFGRLQVPITHRSAAGPYGVETLY